MTNFADRCGRCSHWRNSHVYEDGPCRPGFACEFACTKFVEPMSTHDYVEIVSTNGDTMSDKEQSARLKAMMDANAKTTIIELLHTIEELLRINKQPLIQSEVIKGCQHVDRFNNSFTNLDYEYQFCPMCGVDFGEAL